MFRIYTGFRNCYTKFMHFVINYDNDKMPCCNNYSDISSSEMFVSRDGAVSPR